MDKFDNKIDKSIDTENTSRAHNLVTSIIDIDNTDNSGIADTVDADKIE